MPHLSAILSLKIASRKFFFKVGGFDFVFSPETRIAPSENALPYDQLASGASIYAYVGGNPVNFTDPRGLNPIGGAVAGGEAGMLTCGPYCAVAGTIAGAYLGEQALEAILDPIYQAVKGDSDDAGDDEDAQEEGSGSCPINRVTNPKHHKNSNSPEPNNVDDLFDKSVADNQGRRWVKDEDGVIHRFSKPSNGETHWNGSTSGVDPIRHESIPIEIRRLLK